MRFLLDHDVPAEVGRVLVRGGHESTRLAEVMPATAPDDDVFQAAQARDAILITCNRDDFLDLAKSRVHAGLIIVVRRRSRVAESAALLRLLARSGESGIRGNINFA